MLAERASGILLHPTSLPSRGGIGDLGPAAYEFLDWLADAKQSVWQILPLSPTGYGNSPYSSLSAFAGNPLLVSLERLADRGWIAAARLSALPQAAGPIDFDGVAAVKVPLLREGARNFLREASGAVRERYYTFLRENDWWLEDFVLFTVLRDRYARQAWNRWPRDLAWRNGEALGGARDDLADALDVERTIQFFFSEQWRAIRAACRRRAIRILGDVAIFVSFDSADVWTHRDIFRLNHDLEPEVVAGVPPDAFSATGQYWGNPLYRWDVLQQRGYYWWVQRIRHTLSQCDLIRLDHFRGFESCWEIPGGDATAVRGRWIGGPRDDLFHVLRQQLGDLPFIAEDLGMITAEVHAMRQRLQIPGMRVLQFAFGDRGAHIYLPHRYEANTVVYTGTHDNDTTRGWWENLASADERRTVRDYVGSVSEGAPWTFIRIAARSTANLCVFPLQDVLDVGTEGRMNIPNNPSDNWRWRYQAGTLGPDLAQKLAALTDVTDRTPPTPDSSGGDEPFAV